MTKRTHGYITLGILFFVVTLTSVWYVASPEMLEAQKSDDIQQEEISSSHTATARTGNYIVVNLDTMKLDMMNGETLIETVPLISQGKPGSYYETMGGEFTSDYKVLSHFSSIGHVYMPYSIHVFGNYFIHGIPYYPDGTKVSSTYSGGCIRLSDDDVERVYNFVQKGMPIIITRDDKNSFQPTPVSDVEREDMDMTRLMVAAVSLEFLTQDNEIYGPDDEDTTRRKLLPNLLVKKDNRVSKIYAQALGEKQFVAMMNKKARALGLTNTTFTSTQDAAFTTNDDYIRFMSYIDVYKSYLRKVEGSSTSSLVAPAPIN